MKMLWRVFAILLLMLVALMTFARRDFSGAWIAYSAQIEASPTIHLMTGDGGSDHQISPEGMCASQPRWSPDGEWIAFWNACVGSLPDLLRMHPGGSSPQLVSSGVNPQWSPDGERLFVWQVEAGAFLVEADGSGERPLAQYLVPLQWSADGDWIYAQREGSLHRIHVETGRIESLLTGYSVDGMDRSPDGSQLVLVNRFGDELVRMSTDGGERAVILQPESMRIDEPRWSPDGEWIAFLGGEFHEIYRIRPDGSDLQRVIGQIGSLYNLQWSPDGEWLLFREDDVRGTEILRVRPDGSAIEILTPGPGSAFSPQYAPVSGKDWNPFVLILAALGLIFLSLMRRSSA